jgi:hypothetical protein
MKKVVSRLRQLKSGQKIITVPKIEETNNWVHEDLIELNKHDGELK